MQVCLFKNLYNYVKYKCVYLLSFKLEGIRMRLIPFFLIIFSLFNYLKSSFFIGGEDYEKIGKAISKTTVRLETHLDDVTRATAGTGFFYVDYKEFMGDCSQKKLCYFNNVFYPQTALIHLLTEDDPSKLYVITNRHVLLGKHMHQGNKNSPQLPTSIKFYFNFETNDKLPDFKFDCHEGVNTFLHPTLDIGIIDVSDYIKGYESQFGKLQYQAFKVDDIPGLPGNPRRAYAYYPTHPVFMTGYPKNLYYDETINSPITRGGILSNDLNIELERNPIFYIDMAAFQGSSGSPVFCIEKSTRPVQVEKNHVAIREFCKMTLLGIFKGGPRFKFKIGNHTHFMPMGLGFVIKANNIQEFIERRPTYMPLDLTMIDNSEENASYFIGEDE